MSGITLSAAVRQNLLSLQDTASLLSQTQTRLATGKKVNSALDNPTNFFTAAGLDARASDISNLLDSIGNGVQVLQAANTGITSLSNLVDTAKSIANQVLQQPVGYSTKASATSAAPTGAGPLSVAGSVTDLTNGGANSLQGETFIFQGATGSPVTITVDKAGVNSITAFNTALTNAGLGLTASLASNGSITLTSSNDNASQTLTLGTTAAANNIALSGTATLALVAAGAPVADPVSQATRASLVAQYNQILTQITTTAQDSSFNGVNLLNGDSLKLVFDETGKSSVSITGVTFDPTGLGLHSLTAGSDFIDTNSANSVLTALNTASVTLRSQASAFGANLSIVQIRQDFNKNLINVLQTGSSNLTLADSNEEAANSQALATRQSIATSALALANQSQQNVLQLLR
ncbi:MAG TPA: flagellin [Bradyrhizobium sp.]|jgi:flagellin|uniref:flagellin N-terminal helical domain-containing protein n=1 Tax=Bradyrhizobium sp. TaxID=376 RepID=UPI002BE2F921|nr:flagellin [Bradyrhizobium sp.]HXB77789.1 flagellin [Bradyrhizobium sp.]